MIETKKENVYTDIEGIIEIANEHFITLTPHLFGEHI